MLEDMLQPGHSTQPLLRESRKASWKRGMLEKDLGRWGWGRHSRPICPRPRDVVERGLGSRQR